MSDVWHQSVMLPSSSSQDPVGSLQCHLSSLLQWVVKALEAEESARPADALKCYKKADCTVSLARTVTIPSISSALQDTLGCQSFVECDYNDVQLAEAPLLAGLWPGTETSLQVLDEVLQGLQSSYQLRIQDLEASTTAHNAVHSNQSPWKTAAVTVNDSQQDVCLQLSPCDRISHTAYQPCYTQATQQQQSVSPMRSTSPRARHAQHVGCSVVQHQAPAAGSMGNTAQGICQVITGGGVTDLASDVLPDTPSDPVALLVQQCQRTVHGSLDDVAGLQGLKQELRQAVLMPLKLPHLFTGLRAAPCTFLLYGPPGTGKTMMVEKVAAEAGMSLLCLPPSVLLSKWSGESEKTLRTAFEAAGRLQPCALFIDEIDSLAPQRGSAASGGDDASSRRLLTELLLQLNTLLAAPAPGTPAARVYVFAATNRLQDCDTALLRRFYRRMHVPLPDIPARAAYFNMMLSQPEMSHCLSDTAAGAGGVSPAALSQLVDLTEGYSCSDLYAVCKEAALQPIKELMQTMQDSRSSMTAPCERGTDGADRDDSGPCSGRAPQQLRLLTMQDFLYAVSSIKPAAAEQQAASSL